MEKDEETGKGIIYVMDMESSLVDALVRRVIDMNQYLVFRKWDMEIDSEQEVETYAKSLKGIILSGSAKNINSKKYTPPKIPDALLQTGVPILAICYGMQYLGYLQEQAIVRCWDEQNPKKRNNKKDQGEQGPTQFNLTAEGMNSPLFKGLGASFPIWMKHRYMVEDIPTGWTLTGYTERCPIGAMEFGNIFALQFHPEPHYSLFGRIILHNFLTHACGAETPYF